MDMILTRNADGEEVLVSRQHITHAAREQEGRALFLYMQHPLAMAIKITDLKEIAQVWALLQRA